MSTTLFLRNEAAEYIPATFKGTWTQTAGTIDHRIHQRKAGTSVQQTITKSNAVTGQKISYYRGVSDPVRTQTISGTLNLLQFVSEGAGSLDARFRIHMWVSEGDTDTARGTLLANWEGTLPGAEWPTTAAAKDTGAITLSNVNSQDGDRIIIEIGVAADSTATGALLTSRYGGTGITLIAGGTSSDVPTLIFSDDIEWYYTYLFLNDESAPVTPSVVRGTWTDTTGAVAKKLAASKSTSAAVAQIQRTDTVVTNPLDLLHGRWVSDKISARLISGTYTLMISAYESNVAADAFLHVHAYVMLPDESVRGTLINNVISASELGTGSTTAGVRFTGTFSSVTAQDGDRIVIEIGSRFTNSVTTSYNVIIDYGGTDGANAADLKEGGNGAIGGNVAGWFRLDLPIDPVGVRERSHSVMAG